jgi:hypothetical protein
MVTVLIKKEVFMNSAISIHAQYLEDRIKKIELRIAQSDDYKELKILKRMLSEIKETPPPAEIIVPELVKKYAGREAYSKDMMHTPLPEIKHGERISFIYGSAEHVVKKAGGTMDIEEAQKKITEEFGATWDNTVRLTNYVSCYNNKYPDQQTLKLMPEKLPHQKRASKYMTLVYVGKERLSI